MTCELIMYGTLQRPPVLNVIKLLPQRHVRSNCCSLYSMHRFFVVECLPPALQHQHIALFHKNLCISFDKTTSKEIITGLTLVI